ncbi:response regulator transcription factor [Ghiorsea bivora]|uniref:response regulator transcription factor n=1 Tax=Ghiorsea bivora TaxID=1485545 RepID=UPI00056FD34A|nr:response regulator transcription factor [Ghiorsea bivora]
MHILIIDDQDCYREFLSGLLQGSDLNISIAEAATIKVARAKIKAPQQPYDFVLLDHMLPDGKGLDLLKEARNHYPDLPIAMLSAKEDPLLAWQCLELGALGFIQKNTALAVLLSAIQLMLAGGRYIPPHILPHMPMPKYKSNTSASNKHEQLTPRQSEVLDLLYSGLSNKAIAHRLKISEATVKAHITVIFKLMGVSSRTKLIAQHNSTSQQ